MARIKRLQAQRKFAQGAYIPPTTSERRSDVSSVKENGDLRKSIPNTILKNISAMHLLDIVSFQNIHPHKEPVVVLEKWDNKISANKIAKDNNRFIKVIGFIPKVTSGSPDKPKPKPVVKNHLKLKRAIKPMKKLKNNMRLRSRVINTNKPVFPNQRELKFFKQKLSTHVIKRSLVQRKICAPKLNKLNLRKRPMHTPSHNAKIVMNNKRKILKRKPSVVSEFSSEDETPLKLYNSTKKDNRSLGKNKEKSYQLRSNTLQSSTDSIEKNEPNKECLELQPLVKNTDELNPRVETVPNVNEQGKDLKAKPKVLPTENKHSTITKELVINIVKEGQKPNNSKSNETFYSDKEIERWMNNSLSSASSSDSFKKPQLPINKNVKKKKADKTENPNSTTEGQAQPSTSTSENVRPCLSAALENVKTAEEASKLDLHNSCKNCDSCKKLDVIVNIVMNEETINESVKPVTEKSTSQKVDDVYNFDSEKDAIKENQTFSNFRNKRRKNSTDLLTDEKHYLYLDLLPPPSTHMIQLVTVKVPNQNAPMMRARLIPKSEVNKLSGSKQNDDDVVVVMGQGNFMDELMTKLKVSSKDLKLPGKSPIDLSCVAPANNQNLSQNSQKNSNEGPVLVVKENQKQLKENVKSQKECSKSQKESVKPQKEGIKLNKEGAKSQKESIKGFPRANESAQLVEAPTFYPTALEFENPLAYIEKIGIEASKYGLCKIIPPDGFNPECYIKDDIVFTAGNQYPSKMYTRWGPATRELCAIKKYLATQNVCFKRLPLINGIEVNLPKLYHIVQKAGGLKEVIEKKKWQKLAEDMNFQKSQHIDKKLDHVYVRYLLPYDVLTNRERQSLLVSVEKGWNKKYKKMLERARNPLHRQKRILGESSSEDEDDGEEEGTLDDADDCVVPGRTMNLATFKKVASTSMQMYFPQKNTPTPQEVEDEYWRLVLLGNDHICVYTASIDTGDESYGFPKAKDDPYSKHPWNLKVLSNNPSSVLRSLGSVLSVTTPTLHLGMVFTTSCWHRDPHGLPWIEYLHTGAPKIWYGIPDEQSCKFRKAVETLGPAYCQNKSIWLPSDITMIPPNLLIEHNVSLSKTIQKPGEYIVIFPRAYSCSVCTGFTISESVYFGPNSWLMSVQNDFQEVRDSCEPTMFSLEQLLISMACDWRVAPSVLLQVHSILNIIIQDETSNRRRLKQLKVECRVLKNPPKKKAGVWNVREQAECDICRSTLYLSQVVGLNGKKSFCCLQHALRILEMPANKGRDLSEVYLECFYSNESLEGVLDRLRKRLCPSRD